MDPNILKLIEKGDDNQTFSMLLSVIKDLKNRGVVLYQQKDIINSFNAFSQALKLAIPVEVKFNQNESEIVCVVASLYNNLAACHLERNNYHQVVELCDQVIVRNPNDIKAVYRKSSALMGLANYPAALQCLEIGLRLDPTNKALRNLMLMTNNVLKQQDETMAQGMRKYFK